MIEVHHLTKRFVGRTAVDDISFSVGKGEIVGFLGPNGAGKTTTMRMLTGYLPPSSGTANVAGFDVFNESLKARKEIGYMTESVPLYDDMRVEEYLKFRAGLKGLRRRAVTEGIGRAIELTGLKDVSARMISTLSKGYRQRLGLADALLHRPKLLILDEPTNGLDPNQIRQVRSLIAQLSETHTILLSTHILSEVQMTCRRVMIIHRGKIRADDTPDNLARASRTAATITVEIKAPVEAAVEKFQGIPGVRRVTPVSSENGWQVLEMKPEPDSDAREDICRAASDNHWPLRELGRRQATLEDIFVEITQRD